MKIISTYPCPEGLRKGHDGDACRANLVEDGSIVCIFCGHVPSTPGSRKRAAGMLIDSVIDGLRGAGFKLVSRRYGSEINQKTSPAAYAAACLSGYDPNLLDLVRMSFVADASSQDGQNPPSELVPPSLELQYFESELADNLAADTGYQDELTAAHSARIPAQAHAAIAALTALGFCLHVSPMDDDGRFTLGMTRGKLIGKMGYVAGARAAFSWCLA